jgi:hypothetical protein
MILKGFGFVAFFALVKASSFCIYLSCLVCSLSVVRGEWSRLFCGHNVMLITFLNVRFVLSDFRLLLTFLSIQHRILNYDPTELLTDRGKDKKYFSSSAGC